MATAQLSRQQTPPASAGPSDSSLPYVLPFAIFMALLSLSPYTAPVLGPWDFPFRALVLSAVLYIFSRHVIDLRVASPVLSIFVGVAVFFLWIGPDVLFPGYREHWLFQNSLLGHLKQGVAPEYQGNLMVLATRSLRAIVLVPIIEELFWRAWLMRWLINPHFSRIPLGAFNWTALVLTAVLFASEHGSYWDVGLLTGLIYNLWMVRTKRLGDLVLVHAVTNGCLSAYVILFQRWEYWP